MFWKKFDALLEITFLSTKKYFEKQTVFVIVHFSKLFTLNLMIQFTLLKYTSPKNCKDFTFFTRIIMLTLIELYTGKDNIYLNSTYI